MQRRLLPLHTRLSLCRDLRTPLLGETLERRLGGLARTVRLVAAALHLAGEIHPLVRMRGTLADGRVSLSARLRPRRADELIPLNRGRSGRGTCHLKLP